jgi:hypothetical protein
MDRFSALIKKQKLLAYPEGREFQGLLYMREKDPSLKVKMNF